MPKKRIPKPDNWEQLGWRERAKWHKRVRMEREKAQAYRDIARLHKIASIRKLKGDIWDRTKVEWFLRLVADKALVGFSIRSVEKLAEVTKELDFCLKARPQDVAKRMRLLLKHEFKAIRNECVMAVKEVVKRDQYQGINGEVTYDYKGYKRIKRHVYEKDGVQFKRMSIMVPLDDAIKFKAILSMEDLSFNKWIVMRVRKYVSMKFRRLGEIQGLVDPEIDAKIPDEEMEVIPNAQLENSSQKEIRKLEEKEVGEQSHNLAED